jgi:hypothetical protein
MQGGTFNERSLIIAAICTNKGTINMKTIILTILLGTPIVIFAQKPATHVAKAPRTGDTIWPGSPQWIHAGSPRNASTGDSVLLLCGTDGKLHPLGYAIEDSGGMWVANTPKNSEMVAEHKEIVRLIAAVRKIIQDMPDKKIPRPAEIQIVTANAPDTGYDPYNEVMHWADSISKVYDDPDFYQWVKNHYRTQQQGLDASQFDDPRGNS